MLDSLFNKGFRGSKCKTLLKLAMGRIKLLRNKRDIQLKQMRRELAQLLQNGQESTARIRVEHIIRERNIMAAYDILELFCELVVVRLPIIESQRECPIDLREAVSSLIFAAPRCADLPELLEVRSLFAMKYGKEFVAAATELRPDCGVSRQIIEKLSVKAPSPESKLKLMKEIVKENDVDWDSSSTEAEFFKSPEDLLGGPNQFLGSTQMPIPAGGDSKPHISTFKLPGKEPGQKPSLQEVEFRGNESHFSTVNLPEKEPDQKHPLQGGESGLPSLPETNVSPQAQHGDSKKQFIPFVLPSNKSSNRFHSPPRLNISSDTAGLGGDTLLKTSHSRTRSEGNIKYEDVVEAAQAAAESAERAAHAARAAANLAKSKMSDEPYHIDGSREVISSESDDDFSDNSKSELSFSEPNSDHVGHDNDVQGLFRKADVHENMQEVEIQHKPEGPGSFAIFDKKMENAQGKEYGKVNKWQSGGKSGWDGDDDISNTSTPFQEPQKKAIKRTSGYSDDANSFTIGSILPPPGHPDRPVATRGREHDLPIYDTPSYDESFHKVKSSQPHRLPSFDDDMYLRYPNLFAESSASTDSTHPRQSNELHHEELDLDTSSLAPSAPPVDPVIDDYEHLNARFKTLKSNS